MRPLLTSSSRWLPLSNAPSRTNARGALPRKAGSSRSLPSERIAIYSRLPSERLCSLWANPPLSNGVAMNELPDGTFQKLRELAQNLWWSWQPEIRALFHELDPAIWRVIYHNPVALLQRVGPEEIARRVQDLEM